MGKLMIEEPKVTNNTQVQEVPKAKCRIEEAEKLLKNLNQKRAEILKKIDELKRDKKILAHRLEELGYRRYDDIQRSLRLDNERLHPLKLALDKLNFANHAYHDTLIRSTSLLEDEINFHKLNFQMKHGRNKNLVYEQGILRKTKKIRGDQTSAQAIDSCPTTLEDLNYCIISLCYGHTYGYGIQVSKWKGLIELCSVTHRNSTKNKNTDNAVIETIEQLKWIREKAIANATVKGTVWNSLPPSKTALLDKINLINKESEESKRNQIAVRARIKVVERQVERMEKDIKSLQQQLIICNRRKDAAYKLTLTLRK